MAVMVMDGLPCLYLSSTNRSQTQFAIQEQVKSLTVKKTFTSLLFLLLLITIALTGYSQTKNTNPLAGFKSPFHSKQSKAALKATIPSSNEPKNEIKFSVQNESFFVKAEKYNLNKENINSNLGQYLSLNSDFSFQEINSSKDELGFTHIRYDQFYKGIPLDGYMVLAHFKDGRLKTINGRVALFNNLNINPAITGQQAKQTAKDFVKATELIQEHPVGLIIAKSPSASGYHLVYRVRIDASKPVLQMKNVYVDAATGEVINMLELINDIDATGSASTMYSSTQTITSDNNGSGYRLRENTRKIQTYDATNSGGHDVDTINHILTNVSDYLDADNNWTGVTYLTSFVISNVAQNWWYTSFADVEPDLYILIRDGLNNIVYSTNYVNNTFPPITFHPNLLLQNPPYSVEVWDYDLVGSADFGGSYSINTNTGTQSWNGGGNSGTYTNSTKNNPALDVHWGMEKTYDFYLNVFGRNSFDGNGTTIRNYLNNFIYRRGGVQGPNNAGAFPPPIIL